MSNGLINQGALTAVVLLLAVLSKPDGSSQKSGVSALLGFLVTGGS